MDEVAIGTYLNGEVGKALVPELARIAGITPALEDTPAGVEVVRREAADRSLWFVINHNEEPATVNVPAGHDLVTDRAIAGPLELPARGIAVIQTAR